MADPRDLTQRLRRSLQGPGTPRAVLRRYRATDTSAVEVVVLDGSGHWPMPDDPVGVEQVLLPFVAAPRPGTRRLR